MGSDEPVDARSSPAAGPGCAVVFGATGGIGAAVFGALRAGGGYRQVFGYSRRSEPPLDVTREGSVAAVAACLAASGMSPRLVVVATGMLHDADRMPEKSWRDLDPDALAKIFGVNAIGPALVMKHLLPLLPRQGRAVFAVLSARVGSIADNRLGGWYGYRASKAALNQFVRTAAVELRRTRPEAICVALHPGTVDTRLSAPFARTGLEVQTPETAAARLLSVIDGLRPEQSGGFFDHLGQPVPW